MNEIPANVLLQRYCDRRDDDAFRELVSRYIGLVYGTALRRVGGDAHLAQDIVQLTFTDLARKARSIPPTTPVAGWLHQNTCFRAAGIVRTEQRRQAREQKAAHMESIDREDSASWTRLAPLLDEGLERLPSRLRDALLLRFCEGRDFSSIAKTLGISDDAAQKRVSRGLEQLRSFFARRGVATAAGSLAASLSAQAASAPPASLAAIVAQNSLLSAAASTTGTSAILFMATKTKLALGVAVVVAAGFVIVSQQRETKRLRNELANAREAATARVNASLSREEETPALGENPASAALPRDQLEQAVLGAARDRLWRTDGKRWHALIASIPITDLKGILDVIQRSTAAEVRRVAREELVVRWARVNPQAASAWCDGLPVSPETFSLKRQVAEIWMDADPSAVTKRGPIPARDLSALARHDVQAAASHALALDPSPERETTLSTIGHIWAEKDPEGAVRWLQTLHSRADLLMAFRGMADRLAEVAPANAGLYLETFAAEKKFSEVGGAFAVSWANTDPSAAAKWAAALPPGTEMRTRAMAGIAHAWAFSDPTAAAEWLKPQPRDEAKDKAITQFVSSAGAHDPRLAAALAGEIGDTAMRSAAVGEIVRHWSILDRAAASRWLESIPFLDSAEKRKLAQNVAQPP